MENFKKPDMSAGAVPPVPPVPSVSPLDESQYLLIHQAADRRQTALRAARAATISSVLLLIAGVFALPFSLFRPDWTTLIVLAVVVVGAVEYYGSRRFRRVDPSAARMLGYNQLALLVVVAVYCIVNMAMFSTADVKNAMISPQVRDLMSQASLSGIDELTERLAPIVVYGLFGLLLLVSVFYQGGMAWYYFSRRRDMMEFQTQTPDWIRRIFTEIET